MKKLALLILFAAAGMRAQDKPLTQVFQLKYADANQLAILLRAYGSATVSFPLQSVMIQTPDAKAMSEVTQLIQRYDVPPPPVRNIEVTIYLMSALSTPTPAAIPQELESVVKQLKSMFSYKGYQLIDTEVIRVRAGQGGEASAVVDNKGPAGAKTISQMRFRAATPSTDEKGHAIRIDALKVGLKVPVPSGKDGYSYIDTGISTDVDIREGQKVVVGKVNMDGADRASIVVLTAKVVE
jgi:hypothetical protein